MYNSINAIIWLLETIRLYGPITFKELQERWQESSLSDGQELSRTTFNRRRENIDRDLGIRIGCMCNDGYRYYIEDSAPYLSPQVQNWIISSISVSNLLLESKSLHRRILLQDVPCDKYLRTVIDAMQHNRCLKLRYQTYTSDTESIREFEPYALKLHNQRWYVLAHYFLEATEDKPRKECMTVYAFDRIRELTVLSKKFRIKPDFDAEEFFSECYGVFVGDGTAPEKIVIRAFGIQRNYLKSLPLHPSQRIIREDESASDFEYRLRPTVDFVHQLFSLSSEIEVLSPESLREDILRMAQQSIILHSNR